MRTSIVALMLVACGQSAHSGQTNSAAGASPGGAAPLLGGGAGMSGGGAAGQSAAGTAGGGVGTVFSGADCPTELGLSAALPLNNVLGAVDGTSVRISFDPLASARDYRVYVLPQGDDVSGQSVHGATYRCAGNHAVPFPAEDDNKTPENPGVRTRVASQVQGFLRSQADATLGYVFTTAGAGSDRVPVYALGDPDLKADNVDCYFMRWPESRVKKYTTSAQERAQLLSQHWRDDGVAFYAPMAGADGTQPVYLALDAKAQSPAPLYVTEGPEYEERSSQGLEMSAAFSVYGEAAPGAEPLLRVYYDQACARGHDELVVGQARFEKAFHQGASPVTELHFSGLGAATTLVVEALDASCPFQGIVAPASRPARVDPFMGFQVDYPAFQTPDELAKASATGEVFINGQGADSAPHVIARACLKVASGKPPEADWAYDGAPEAFSEPLQKGFQIWEQESPSFNVQYHTVATDEFTIGTLFGELWATYGDWAADTNGKLRVTPKARATLAEDSFVHASMEVDMVSTQRRYPQLLISDQDWPVQDNLAQGATVLFQTFGGITMPIEAQIQFCDHRTWDVNNQCPLYDLQTLGDGDARFLSPRPEINGFSGVDRTVRFDVYVSTSRAYLFTHRLPYGCVDLPAGKLSTGSATVTFGDVLYHSGADLEAWYPFHLAKLHNVTSRHYSNLAFSSGVPAPVWDETRIPCVSAGGLK